MTLKNQIVALFALSLATQALSIDVTSRKQWNDLEVNKKYSLDRDLQLKVDTMATKTSKAGDTVRLPKGLSVTLTEITGLSEINVSLVKFTIPNCAFTNTTTEILIVNPEKTGVNDPSVGVKIEPGCSLEIFVENKDWYKKSLF